MNNTDAEFSGFVERIQNNFINHSEQTYCTVIKNNISTELTWFDLERDCHSVMRALSNIEPGVVLIFLRHGVSLHGSFIGSMLGGHIPSFMPCSSVKQNPSLYWTSHQSLLEHILPSAIITSSEVFEEMKIAGLDLFNAEVILIEDLPRHQQKEELSRCSNNNIALLQHSSGTTGSKKGVALSHAAIEKHAISYASAIELVEEDIIVSWLPLYHDMGLMACMIMPAYFAIPVVHIDPFEWVGQPHVLFEAIEEYSGTLSWMPNFAFEHLALSKQRMVASYELSSMRAFISCSEVCKAESFDKFLTAFADFGVHAKMLQTCYAMAETVFATTQTQINIPAARLCVNASTLNRNENVQLIDSPNQNDEGTRVLVETGSIIDGLKVKIVDEMRNELPNMVIGEIAISGSFLFQGYHGLTEMTEKRLEGGCYYTCDLGFLYSGKLFVLGRIDDLIIIQGRNIYAHQVESLISQVDGVKAGRICAFGEFDPRVGSEVLILVCELEEKLDKVESRGLKSIISALLQSIIEVVPKRIHLVEKGWLVKTSSGKIGRKENKNKIKLERSVSNE